ncbi:MAG TPA: spermidine/putrescine ABC transporter substrate-binding protein, partial [Acidobacteriota bacterium]|nr:spermidine/putrescine ABC transporter substrate-binding protein [Acidobacteriota bacterium]
MWRRNKDTKARSYTKTGHYAILLLILALFACGKPAEQRKTVNLYLWSAYASPAVFKEFEARTGIRVQYDTYDSNQTLLEKLRSGVTEYDIVCPTNWLIHTLVQLNLVENLDPARLPNLANVQPQFRDPSYDPRGAHSIPFVWGTSGIGYNKTKVAGPVDSWGILWDPKYTGRISMLDGGGDAFVAALKWKGHSINSNQPELLEEAYRLLLQQKPLVKVYNSSNFDEILLSGDVWIAYGWSGQLAKAAEQNPDITYVVPKEGSMVWMDTLVIPRNAPHKDSAYKFLNFVLDGKIAAEVTNYTGYANANSAAAPYVKPEYLKNPARYPDAATLARCEWSIDQPE